MSEPQEWTDENIYNEVADFAFPEQEIDEEVCKLCAKVRDDTAAIERKKGRSEELEALRKVRDAADKLVHSLVTSPPIGSQEALWNPLSEFHEARKACP